jgi:hypothetical protein
MKMHHLAMAVLGMSLLSGPAGAQERAAPEVEPEAMQALQRMRTYLSTLTSFEAKSESSLDIVLESGQKVQLDGTATYRVRRPDAFVVETSTPRKQRQFVYDGRKFTVYAPQLGYYAQVDAPPTIRQTLDVAADRYGLTLPLDDLFRWSDAGADNTQIEAAFDLGEVVIDGATTTQYAFRQKDVDWQVWIEKGDRPLPRKVVIVDRTDEARPAYSARLTWNTNPTFAPSLFAFTPGKDAKAIQIASTPN